MTNFIDLHQRGKGVVARAKVSSEDYTRLSQNKWYLFFNSGKPYGRRVFRVNGKQKTVYLHQEVLGVKDGFVIDHKNRDTLDNRRCNLRWASKSLNAHNSDRKGVYFCKWRRRFFAHCRVDGKRHSLGGHATREEAEMAVVNFRTEMGLV